MPSTTACRLIHAPLGAVFDAVSDADKFSQAIPHISSVEFLSDIRKGVGVRFRETRLMRGREAATVLEVTEYQENERIRLVSDAGGSIWDSVFTTQERHGATELCLAMEARPHSLSARLVTPFVMGMVSKAVEADMDAVKEFCER